MKQPSAIALTIICLLFCSQVFPQSIDKEAIPADYNCPNCVLVVIKQEPGSPPKLNEMLQEKIVGDYEGKVVFITAAELDTNKLYTDINVYRFVLKTALITGHGSRKVTKANGQLGDFNYTVTGINLYLYDRVTKKNNAGFFDRIYGWPKTLKTIVEALNKALKK